MPDLSEEEKARVVELILDGRAEVALRVVCEAHGRSPPKIRVGRVKGHSRSLAVYEPRSETIYLSDGSLLRNPFVILHELYHHLRMFAGRHRGTEKHANRFAISFLSARRTLGHKFGKNIDE